MDRQKLNQLQTKLDLIIGRHAQLIRKISMEYNTEIEKEANNCIREIKEVITQFNELQIFTQICFADRAAFNIQDDLLLQIDSLIISKQNLLQPMIDQLMRQVQLKQQESMRKNMGQRQVQAAKITAEIYKKNQDKMDKDQADLLIAEAKKLKEKELIFKEKMEKGEANVNLLGDKVYENKEEAMIEVQKVQKARAAMKKNKDIIFFFITLLCLIGLIFTLILG